MDFNDTPDQAKFRAKCKEWLDKNAELKDTGKRANVESNLEELIAKAKVWQKRNTMPDGQCFIGQRNMAV